MIDDKFDRDAKHVWRRDLSDLSCLVLDVDAGRHSMVPTVLMETWAVRSTMPGLTVYVSSVDVGAMPGLYGPEAAAVFKKSKALRRLCR